MMEIADALRELLKAGVLSSASARGGRYFVMLKEKGADAKLKRVDIFDVSDNAILIKMDDFCPQSAFRGDKGECCRCDYVLVTEFKGQTIILFIEMKSIKLKNNEILCQFKGAECLLEYCDSVLFRFHEKKDLLKNCKKHFAVLYKANPINKKPTRIKPIRQSNLKPEHALKIPLADKATTPMKSLIV